MANLQRTSYSASSRRNYHIVFRSIMRVAVESGLVYAVLPIVGPLRELLEAAQATRKSPWDSSAMTADGKPWGESGLNQSFQRARDRAGLDTWSFHDLRHFFVSELFRRGAPAHVVQALARHSDLKTTQRYADLDANDLRAAINLLQVDENRGNAPALTEGSD